MSTAMKCLPRDLVIPLLVFATFVSGCDSRSTRADSNGALAVKPNILFIVWDTVRADRLSLYGWHRRTTPFLDEWAQGARVFENCLAAGSTTVPSHGAMFTGLMPTEHQANNEDPRLADEFETLAELLKAAGYGTYMFAENPHISERNNFSQGFDVVEHPWSPHYVRAALRITYEKVPPHDQTCTLRERLKGRLVGTWGIKACGELAQRGVETWLSQQDPDQPFFIFLNYMEAHRPLIPRPRYREKLMTPEQIRASYLVDRRWVTMWSYVFGLTDYMARELELTSLTYDAALLELDDFLHRLLEYLRTHGYLDNTVVVLVGDHGEHLGEHHLFDHQYSVYQPVMRVPLVVHYPARVPPGRDRRPVSNIDLYPTLLELAGLGSPVKSKAVSLLHAPENRPLVGEYPAVMEGPFKQVRQHHPGFDPNPWRRTLRAYLEPPYKFIHTSDGRHELYDLENDPDELRNLFHQQPQLAQRLATNLQAYVNSLAQIHVTRGPAPALDPVERQRLEMLGYLGTPRSTSDTDDASRPDNPEGNDDQP